jgi:hypothetical protein
MLALSGFMMFNATFPEEPEKPTDLSVRNCITYYCTPCLDRDPHSQHQW